MTLAACGPVPVGLAPELIAEIDSVLAHYDVPDSPGAAVMVIDSGEIVFAKGYGHTTVDGTAPLDRTTPFRLGSVSKQFATMAIMQLAERGDLGYDDPALTWIPEIARFGDAITIRHLMTHTSGLPDYYDVLEERYNQAPSVDQDSLFTNVDAAATYLDWGEPLAEPGETYAYSNPAYELLALIVERVSEQTFGEFLDEHVFDVAGMTTAIVRDRPDVVIPGRAVGYYEGEDGWVEDDDHPLNWMVGAGGVYASLDDLSHWDSALRHHTLVSEETLAEAYSPTVLNDGSVSQYGFGWAVSEDGLTVSHGGAWVGFRTQIARSLDTGTTAILLTNSSASGEVQNAVIQPILEAARLRAYD
jgi:CubicO group peptidase (beta-lactamase class C family)